MAASISVTAALLILALVYYAGSSARIAGDYTSVASPANRALAAEMSAYARDQAHDVAAARQDLLNEVKTESSFDNLLSQVTFPGAAAAADIALVQADHKREKLIRRQARAPSVTAMRSFDGAIQAADAAVAVQVRDIRRDLGLPAASGQFYY